MCKVMLLIFFIIRENVAIAEVSASSTNGFFMHFERAYVVVFYLSFVYFNVLSLFIIEINDFTRQLPLISGDSMVCCFDIHVSELCYPLVIAHWRWWWCVLSLYAWHGSASLQGKIETHRRRTRCCEWFS